MNKLVLTGAAGRLGSYLREPLSKLAKELVSSDIVDDIGKRFNNESYVKADLENYAAILELLKDADMVVHFGALGDESSFEEILGPNIVGAYNVWEAAYQKKVRRVVYASSIHAVGMHSNKQNIGIDAPHRPDTFYGLAKCFSEDLGSLYWDKRGVESVCLRILSCAKVSDPRGLGSWLSYDDLIHLVECSISATTTGFSIVYGVSDNDRVPVDNSAVNYLGYRPKDNAEQFAEEILAASDTLDPMNPEHSLVGGAFAAVPLGESGQALMNIVDDAKKHD
ncbi:MAG: NAD-dependent epimerase/dehydratase family protein [Gammaproteobacteria bacterium]